MGIKSVIVVVPDYKSRRLVGSTFSGPVNIASEEMVTINQLAYMIMDCAGEKLAIKHVPRPSGVRGTRITVDP
jgi:hypothetical protein